MEITDSFLTLLQSFDPVFTAPTYQTFVVIITGWILSQRHRYVTEVIFSSGRVGDGHWSRFHRFFSHAAWDIDTFSSAGQVGRHDSRPGATFSWTVDDTLCRKRGLTSRQESSGKVRWTICNLIPFAKRRLSGHESGSSVLPTAERHEEP